MEQTDLSNIDQMSSIWTVESMHINVPVGDCAIHLLVKNVQVDEKPIKEIHAAVLIDGGTTSRKIPGGRGLTFMDTSPIRRVVKWINSRKDVYSIKQKTNFYASQLTFDTIIMTHWDEDHYGGLVKTLKEDAIDATKSGFPISYLQWSVADDGSFKPLTVFYAPNIKQVVGSGARKLNGVPATMEVQDGDDEDESEIAIVVQKAKKKPPTPKTVYTFARFRYVEGKRDMEEENFYNVLGVNFFTNRMLPEDQRKLNMKAADLLIHNPPDLSGQPGMYGVGVLRRAFDLTAGAISIINDPGVTGTNRSSIACLIMYAGATPTSAPHCSHYFAGDLEQSTESEIVKWMVGSGIDSLSSMKLSHHGAHSSTPLSLAEKYKPMNVVVSNPYNKFIHPGWELMILMGLWAKSSTNKQRAPRMWATKYPFYLSKDKNGKYNAVKDTFEAGNRSKPGINNHAFSGPDKAWVEYIGNVWKNVFRPAKPGDPVVPIRPNEYEDYRDNPENQTPKYLLDLCLQKWQECAYPEADGCTNTVAASAVPTLKTTTLSNLLEFVMIVCTNDLNTDGKVLHKTYQTVTPSDSVLVKRDRPSGKRSTKAIEETDEGASSLGPGIPRGRVCKKLKTGRLTGISTSKDDLALINILEATDGTFTTPWPTNPDEMDSIDADSPDMIDFAGSKSAHSHVNDQVKPVTIVADLVSSPRAVILPIIPKPKDPQLAGVWYVYSSDVSKAKIEELKITTFSRMTEASPWDGFISTLTCSMISLASEPIGTETSLEPTDEWFSWMSDCLNVQNMSMIHDSSSAGVSIGGFYLALQLKPPGETLELDTSSPVLIFSTAQNILKNTFEPATPPTAGLRDGATAVVLGLADQTTPETVTLTELINFAGLNDLSQDPFIVFLTTQCDLTLPYTGPDGKSTGTGARNAIWFEPQSGYRTTCRLQLDLLDESRRNLNSFLDILGLPTPKSASVICRRTTRWNANNQEVVLEFQSKLTLISSFEIDGVDGEPPITLDTSIELQLGKVDINFTLNTKTASALAAIIAWLTKCLELPGDTFDFQTWLTNKGGNTSFAEFNFRRISIELASDKKATRRFLSFALVMELHVKIGNPTQDALFLVTYKYVAGLGGNSLEADLWTAPTFDTSAKALGVLPDFENYALLEPLLSPVDSWPTSLDLAKLGGFEDAPSEIPTLIMQAQLLVASEGIAFTGQMKANRASSAKVPVISLDELDLAVSYRFRPTTGSGFSASLLAKVLLEPAPGAEFTSPAQLTGLIEYDGDKSSWTLVATVENLYGSSLFQFFDSDIQKAISPVIQSICIASLEVTYDYDSRGAASNFVMDADLVFGDLRLTLDFIHHGNKDWTFTASAQFERNKSKTTTIGDILANLTGLTDEQFLPDFIKDTEVKLESAEDRVSLAMARTIIDNQPGVFFSFDIDLKLIDSLPELKFQYFQFCTNEAGDKKAPLKRIFVTALDSLPEIDVPLVGNITQPFDEVLLMWVQPQVGSDGLTKAEIEYINSEIKTLQLPVKQLVYKSKKANPALTDVVISNGLHFMMVLKDNQGRSVVALDYLFGDKSKVDGKSSTTTELVVHKTADEPPKSAPDTAGGSGMVAYQKAFGPLAVKNIGLNYKNSTLTVKLDATVTIGPIAFELIGAGIGLNLGKGFGLNKLPTPSFTFDGMGAAFDRPPLTVAGELLRVNSGGTAGFIGALQFAFQPWMFAAAGFYGKKIDKASGKDYTTAFVYAVLNGPLITLEFATITGVTAGFGYNTNLRLPSAAEIPTFPLIKPPGGSGGGAQGALDSLLGTTWFFPQNDCFWIAAGLSVTAFELLEVTAVVVVEWDPAVKLGLYGLATASIPSSVGGKGDGATFAVVQLGLAATVDFGAGTMKIDGQLTPASYILDKNCHLTGGFALYSWFGDEQNSALKGDWVFTIGGYHNAYVVPPQYPRPPRLAISWQFNREISISGQSYFAITPKVCMGGGRLDITLTLGPLSAWLDAYIDFLINFKPFHFIAQGGISVGVKYTMDLWLVTLHISVEIGAVLYIQGPPINGRVHVNFWVFGFDINFGGASLQYDALSLEDFITLVCKADQSTGAGTLATITADTPIEAPSTVRSPVGATTSSDTSAPHVFSVENGLIPSGDPTSDPNADMWMIRANDFSFMISCKFATSAIDINTCQSDANHTVKHTAPVSGTGVAINAKPMRQNNIRSSVTVSIWADPPPRPTGIRTLSNEPPPDVPIWRTATGIQKNLPNGLWGQYDASSDPSSYMNNNQLLNGTKDGTTPLLCGVHILHPDPVLSELDTTKPFDFQKFSVEEVRKDREDPTTDWTFPPDNDGQEDFGPAEQIPTDKVSGTNQWDAVRDAWQMPAIAGNAFADAWRQVAVEAMGWDPAKAPEISNGKASQLLGQCPQGLMNEIYADYLWAPYLNDIAV